MGINMQFKTATDRISAAMRSKISSPFHPLSILLAVILCAASANAGPAIYVISAGLTRQFT